LAINEIQKTAARENSRIETIYRQTVTIYDSSVDKLLENDQSASDPQEVTF